MSSTSVKHRNFISEPILNRPVTDVPGIGVEIGRLMRKNEIDSAEQLLGDYLKLRQDRDKYLRLLQLTYGVPSRYAQQIYNAMKEWSNNFLE